MHGLQRLFRQVRTFAFVAGTVEVTDLFAEHPVERALEAIFGGDVLDVDADSDYGAAFGQFHEEFPDLVTRRTTVVILGDDRVEVVRDLDGLDRVTEDIVARLAGR